MREEPGFVKYRVVLDAPLPLAPELQAKKNLTADVKRRLLQRDGYHCRFCGVPVIRGEVRDRIRKAYRNALPWGNTKHTQHAAFRTMWVQYDHLLPRSRGGSNDLDKLVITCAPCNYGRMERTLEEVGLIKPMAREPITTWDGLERFR